MRKRAILMLLALAALLSGCEKYREVENLAYVIMLGVDLTEENQVRISALIPTITGSGASESGEASDSGHHVYAAAGEDFDHALNRLRWIVPRSVDLSQLKVIMVSERLARSDQFMPVSYAMMATPQLYNAARLAVCEGEAQAFLESENEMLGTRIVTDLDAMFEDYTSHAFIPDGFFADVFYSSLSIYSDPVAIYSPFSETEATASVVMPNSAEQTGDAQPQKNRFLGACVFRKGAMRGKLDAESVLYCELLRGKAQSFQMRLNSETLDLSMSAAPEIRVNTRAEPAQILIEMRLLLRTKTERADAEQIAAALQERILETIAACKRMGVEPFQFAEAAAGSFATVDQWLNYDWHARFADSEILLHIQIQDESA